MAAGVDLSKTLSGGSEELFDSCCSRCLEDGRSVEADKYCVDCEMYFCNQCLKHHKKFPTTRAHTIVDKPGQDSGTGNTRNEEPTERCVTHNRKLIDMYCGDHEVVCCAACIAMNHRTCVKVDYLPDVARRIKESQEYNDVKDMLLTVHYDLQGELTKRKDNLSSLENESENILAEINHNEEDLISKIRALAQTTRESFNIKLTEGRKTLEEDIKNISSAFTRISLNEENLSSGNESEIFAKVKHGKTAVNDCKVLLKDLSRRSNRKMLCFVANDKLKSDVNESECIGIIKINEQKTDSSKIKLKEVHRGEKSKGEEKKKDPEAIQYTATFSGKYKVNKSQCMVTTACVLDNKSLMIFDHTNRALKRLSMDNFKIIDQLELQGSSYCICSVGTEEVAVALWLDKKIQLVSVGRTMTLTRSFSTDYYCYGVAFSEVSGEFYVSTNSNTVNVYDKNGKLMKTYDKAGEGSYMFSATVNVAWNEDKTVLYVTDWKKGLIALSMSGDLLCTFSDSELKYAYGVCVLPGDVILVSGVDSNNVIQVDKRGKKIGTLLGAGDNLNSPSALEYDRNTSRLIVGHGSNEIHVYSLDKK